MAPPPADIRNRVIDRVSHGRNIARNECDVRLPDAAVVVTQRAQDLNRYGLARRIEQRETRTPDRENATSTSATSRARPAQQC